MGVEVRHRLIVTDARTNTCNRVQLCLYVHKLHVPTSPVTHLTIHNKQPFWILVGWTNMYLWTTGYGFLFNHPYQQLFLTKFAWEITCEPLVIQNTTLGCMGPTIVNQHFTQPSIKHPILPAHSNSLSTATKQWVRFHIKTFNFIVNINQQHPSSTVTSLFTLVAESNICAPFVTAAANASLKKTVRHGRMNQHLRGPPKKPKNASLFNIGCINQHLPSSLQGYMM